MCFTWERRWAEIAYEAVAASVESTYSIAEAIFCPTLRIRGLIIRENRRRRVSIRTMGLRDGPVSCEMW